MTATPPDPHPWITAPVHLPYTDGEWRHRMGLRTLDLDEWIEIGPAWEDDLAERRRVLTEHRGQALAAVPGSDEAAREVLVALAAHLARQFPDRYRVDGSGPPNEHIVNVEHVVNLVTGERFAVSGPMHPIEVAGRLVQEDLLLLVASGDAPVLAAACVCFPNRWDLPAKIGRPLAEIHAPVPAYEAQLGAPTAAFLERLQSAKPVWRLAWSVVDLPWRYQPGDTRRGEDLEPVSADNAGDVLYLRVERETLRRFPQHGSVLFTIRTTMTPFSWFAGDPGEARRLAAALDALPDDVAAYKGVQRYRAAAAQWLRRAAAGPVD